MVDEHLLQILMRESLLWLYKVLKLEKDRIAIIYHVYIDISMLSEILEAFKFVVR